MLQTAFEVWFLTLIEIIIRCHTRDGGCRYSAVFYEEGAWDASAAWYNAEVAEGDRNGDGTPWAATPHFEGCGAQGNSSSSNKNKNKNNDITNGTERKTCATVKDVVEDSISSLGALLDQYRVDIYAAGHVHSYVLLLHPSLSTAKIA